jgi:hypothetical protein
MKLICPRCDNTNIHMEENIIYLGEIQIDSNYNINLDTINITNYRRKFYCMKCNFHTHNIKEFHILTEPAK